MTDSKKAKNEFYVLDADKIVETVGRLAQRIHARFPDSGLFNVCNELKVIAGQAKRRSAVMSRPFWMLRLLTAIVVLAVLAAPFAAFFLLDTGKEELNLPGLIQLLDAGINDVVFIGAAIFFLATIEIRIKRRRALTAIHELRSIAHIIDMHQLTKDPERLRAPYVATSVSPVMKMKPYELSRYLDYCSEMLSLTGKVAALYVQNFDDSVAIASANEVEQLCTGLSRKIWQKIMMLGNDAKGPSSGLVSS